MESDYEEEGRYGNLTDPRNLDNGIVIEGFRNDNNKDDTLNCSNVLCAPDDGMHIHKELDIIVVPSSKDWELGSSDSNSSFRTAKKDKIEMNISGSEFSASDLSLVSLNLKKVIESKHTMM